MQLQSGELLVRRNRGVVVTMVVICVVLGSLVVCSIVLVLPDRLVRTTCAPLGANGVLVGKVRDSVCRLKVVVRTMRCG